MKRKWKRIFNDGDPNRTIQIVPIQMSSYMNTETFCQVSKLEINLASSASLLKKIIIIEFQDHCKVVSNFFNTFGDVESTHNDLDENFYFVLVQFKDAKIAEDLVKRSRVVINDIEFQVESTKISVAQVVKNVFIQVVDFEPSFQPTSEDSPTNILNLLDDDCLRLIFEKVKHLSDIYSITNVCMRFNRIAKQIFATKINQECIDLIDLVPENEVTLLQIEDFLCDFGSSVLSIQIKDQHYKNILDPSNILLKTINKYCKNLEKLELTASSVKNATMSQITSLFQHLKYLRIDLSTSIFEQFKNCLLHCTQLHTLDISGQNASQSSLPAVTLPKLIDFHISNPGILYDEFLAHNPQIEKLDVIYSTNVCKLIVNKMSNIRTLTLDCENNNFTETNGIYLKELKHLEIGIAIQIESLTNIFPLKNITELVLSMDFAGIFNHTLLVELAQNLRNLKTLVIDLRLCKTSFSKHITTVLLKQMLQHLNQLSRLKIYWPEESTDHNDEINFNEISEVIENRANKIKLSIELVCNLSDPSETRYTVYKSKWLCLDTVSNALIVEKVYEYKTYQSEYYFYFLISYFILLGFLSIFLSICYYNRFLSSSRERIE